MRQFVIRILMVATFLFLAGISFAQDTISGRPTTPLNVRSGPGTDYDIVTVIYPYNRVNVLGRSSTSPWLLVDVVGIPGWVVQDGMAVNATIASLPVLADDGTPLSEEIVSASETEELDRFSSFIGIRAPAFGNSPYPIGRSRGVINVRAEPSLDAEIMLVIRGGSQFFVVEESEDEAWYRIEWSSNRFRRDAPLNTGWVARHLVAIVRYI